jgi:hypothetical protein
MGLKQLEYEAHRHLVLSAPLLSLSHVPCGGKVTILLSPYMMFLDKAS